jgi:hypothetical protein
VSKAICLRTKESGLRVSTLALVGPSSGGLAFATNDGGFRIHFMIVV